MLGLWRLPGTAPMLHPAASGIFSPTAAVTAAAELAKSAADELVTNVLTSRRVAEVRGLWRMDLSARKQLLLRRMHAN